MYQHERRFIYCEFLNFYLSLRNIYKLILNRYLVIAGKIGTEVGCFQFFVFLEVLGALFNLFPIFKGCNTVFRIRLSLFQDLFSIYSLFEAFWPYLAIRPPQKVKN